MNRIFGSPNHPNPEPTSANHPPSKMAKGTVATLGHPDNKILIVKGEDHWRYVDNGRVVSDEDFRAGWDLYLPAYDDDEDFEPESMEPQMVGHPDNPPANSSTVLSGYKNLVYSISQYNRSVHPNVRISVPFGVQEAIRRYVDERKAIESIWNQQQEDETWLTNPET
jgi:hypothetical protein